MKTPSRKPVLLIASVTTTALLMGSGGAVAGSLITSRQIKDGTVTSADIRNGTINLRDIKLFARRALAGQDGTDGTNGTDGVAGPAGPTGPVGPPGPAGIQGPKGDSGVAGPRGLQGIQGVQGIQGEQGEPGVAAFYTVQSEPSEDFAFAYCDPNDAATGGGGIPDLAAENLRYSAPVTNGDGMPVGWEAAIETTAAEPITAFAVCADSAAPAHTVRN
ncbi:MAG: collagen-like protein [Nocardioides sp.]|nr:collagen-like protein [Nocardioides sp.]